MGFVSAFVTVLSISSIKSRVSSQTPARSHQDNVQNVGIVEKSDPPRPHMLACDSEGKCPDGSMCMRLVGKYGVCVVQDMS